MYKRPHYYTDNELYYTSKEICLIYIENCNKYDTWIPLEEFEKLLKEYQKMFRKDGEKND